MEQWKNKVAVVTGSSSGIGETFCKDLIKSGLIVVGLARRKEKTEQIRGSLPKHLQTNLHCLKCDVSKEEDVLAAFKWIEENLGGADILINNAGCLKAQELCDMNNTQAVLDTLNTNVLGVVFCTRSAFTSIKNRQTNGHIILINSVAGHIVPNIGGVELPSFNIYCPSKHAITAMNEIYRMEFKKYGLNCKITSISPGVVDTDIFPADFDNVKETMPMLKCEDISNALLYVLGTPPHVQIHELTIKPMGELV